MVVPPTATTNADEDVADAAVGDVLHGARHRSNAAAEQMARTCRAAVTRALNDETTARFSTGIERLPETPSKRRTGRFSNGIEQRAATHGKLHVGSFGDGIERVPTTAAARRVGSFADSHSRAPA
jgi:hypothetical protein